MPVEERVRNFPMHPDFVDLLRAFVDRDVRFMVVGGYRQQRRRP